MIQKIFQIRVCDDTVHLKIDSGHASYIKLKDAQDLVLNMFMNKEYKQFSK